MLFVRMQHTNCHETIHVVWQSHCPCNTSVSLTATTCTEKWKFDRAIVHATHLWVKLLHNFIHCCVRYTGVACVVGPSVTTSSTDFSFQNLVFWDFFEFSAGKSHLKINISHILNPNLTKWIPLNPAHQDLSDNTKGTFQFLWKFSAMI